jgi:hypothetical protein
MYVGLLCRMYFLLSCLSLCPAEFVSVIVSFLSVSRVFFYLKRAVLKYHYQERKLPLYRATLVRRPELLLPEVTILLHHSSM